MPLLRLRRGAEGAGGDLPSGAGGGDLLGSAARTLLPPFLVSNLTAGAPPGGGGGLSAITAAELAGILHSLKRSVTAEASAEALTESVVQTLLENRLLFGKGDMLTLVKLLLHTVEGHRTPVILQPLDFARLLKVVDGGGRDVGERGWGEGEGGRGEGVLTLVKLLLYTVEGERSSCSPWTLPTC